MVTDLTDKGVYLQPIIQLNEVIIKEYSLKRDVAEAQNADTGKRVFFTPGHLITITCF